MRFLHLNSHFPPMVSTIPKFALISLLVLFHHIYFPQPAMANDTLLPFESVSVGETLTSDSEIFELGFFTPPNTTRTYIGIWYKNIPETILWVGNRENPLSSSDQSASLNLTSDGNLRLFDGKSTAVWSSNITVLSNSSIIAILSDTGNLILKEHDASSLILWQSFQYLCGVILTTIQIQINTTLGQRLVMDSWISEDDPAPGSFTFELVPQIPVQVYIRKGSEKYYRSGPWNGIKFVGMMLDGTGNTNTWSIHQNNQTGVLSFATNRYDDSSINIVRLFPDGSFKSMVWNGTDWSVVWKEPETVCDVYRACGSFGVCNPNKSPICDCLKGFVPNSEEEWRKGNWRDGCVRRTELLCSKNTSIGNLTLVSSEENDGFWKLRNAKVPDLHHYLSSKDSEGCRLSCLSNCLCTAYAYVNGIGCLVWTGDLVDSEEFPTSGEDLFIRVAHSELLDTRNKKSNKNIVLIISLTTSLAIFTLSLFTYGICRFGAKIRGSKEIRSPMNMIRSTKDTPQEHESALRQVDTNELPTIKYEELFAATNGFSEENKIGEGGFGAVFRGKMQQGQEIAVKRLSSHSRQGINEFINEIKVISKLQHRNLVRILGFCIQGDEQLIVYEYLPNGSLDTCLFDERKKDQLNWPLRVNIIQCVARGLSYLHLDSRLKVIHRDLKASNILLDDNMNPKISDFGLARTFHPTQDSGTTIRVVGTFGYMSPEYVTTGKFSEKSDVYSYGVLVLEIISGRRNNSFSYEDEDLNLVNYAWRLWSNGRGQELVNKSFGVIHCDEILRCIHVGLLCVQDHPNDRPTMSKVVLMLSSETPLITKPKKPSFFSQNRSRCDNGSVSSKNELTISDVEGRP